MSSSPIRIAVGVEPTGETQYLEIDDLNNFTEITGDILFEGLKNGNQSGSLTLDQIRDYTGSKTTGELVELDLDTYYYFGLIVSDGSWRIDRVLKSDIDSEQQATQAANSQYGSLSAAWAALEGLSYS